MSAITPFEKDLEKKLQDLSADITMSPELESKIKFALKKEKGKKGVVPMKHKTLKRVLVTAAALSLTTVTVVAGSIYLGRSSSSSTIPDYQNVPTKEQLAEDLEYTPKVLPEFSNGFAYKEAHVVHNTEGDDEFATMNLDYVRNDAEIMIFTEAAGRSVSTGEKSMYGDTALYYTVMKYKAVPEDYQPTEDELKAEKAGELAFGYGTDEISVQTTQQVSWTQKDVTYTILFMGTDASELPKEELMEMAQEYIDHQ